MLLIKRKKLISVCMGQKVNPILFRMTNNEAFNHLSSWSCANKIEYKNFVVEDAKIRNYFNSIKQSSFISSISIERKNYIPHITINASRSSAIIGKKTQGWDLILLQLKKIIKKEVSVNIVDIRNADGNAQIIANNMAEQISKRVPYKKVIKTSIKACMKSGTLGIKVLCSGRLNGAEIARSEKFQEGSMPLHKIGANIEYALSQAKTIYGIIGLKVLVYQKPNFFN